MTLQHRIIMAPLTRYRAFENHVPMPMVADYYAQRASVPGTLIISEATFISPRAGGYKHVPGIWNDEQCAAWKRVTDAVHSKGSYIYLQLWCLGRAGSAKVLVKDGFDVVSSSDIPIHEDDPKPRPLREEEIWGFIQDYANAARNAVEKAGFDGVEIHGANGYMVDQFTQSTCNKRTDAWGGSDERRARFAIEVTKAVTKAVGPDRVGIRLSPYSLFQGMRMDEPIPPFSHLVRELKKFKLSYLHMVESRLAGNADVEDSGALQPFIDIWANQSPFFLAGGYNAESSKRAADEDHTSVDVAIVFGRHFISNPDLPYRLRKGLTLNRYRRDLFYKRMSPEGYIDYDFSTEFLRDQRQTRL